MSGGGYYANVEKYMYKGLYNVLEIAAKRYYQKFINVQETKTRNLYSTKFSMIYLEHKFRFFIASMLERNI